MVLKRIWPVNTITHCTTKRIEMNRKLALCCRGRHLDVCISHLHYDVATLHIRRDVPLL